MNIFQIATISAMTVNIILGIMVFVMNPTRRANRCFLITTASFLAWLMCLAVGSVLTDDRVLIWIAEAGAISALIPISFDLLRISISKVDISIKKILLELRVWPFLFIPVFIICQTSLFVQDVTFSESGFAQPIYGPGQIIYVVYWLFALAYIAKQFTRDFKLVQGLARSELGFTVLAFALAALLGIGLAQIIPLLTGHKDVIQLAPLSVIALDGIIAYGIVTQRIMNVGDVIRRITAYSLLTAYLVVLYMAVLTGLCFVLSFWFTSPGTFCHLVSALVIAFSMAPAHGKMQKVTDRLFINMQAINERKALQQANEVVMSIGTTDQLVTRFANVLEDATGTDRVTILLPANDGAFSQVFPVAEPGAGLHFGQYEPLVTMLGETKEPVGVDVLRRMRVTGARLAVLEHLQVLNTSVVIGIRAKGQLEGVLLLGPRLSGKLYSAPEQDTLQMLCNELGIALENARLYTDVQNSKIYNDILLDALANGVIAIDNNKKVIVFNEKARAITGMKADEVIGHPVAVLPDSIVAALDDTLNERQKLQDKDVSLLLKSGDTVPVRLSTSVFHGHTDDKLGALLVINDMTQLKVLEEQVRRTDRLSSLGTLSAGIAHEIKNPLVSIKTFTQLLPERYEDNEFRATFFELIGKEVTRIDELVNRLLNFARPTKPSLETINLHELLDDCLTLVGEQMRSQNIQLVRSFAEGTEELCGDADLLKQAFVNFILNAIQCMEDGGDLTIATSVVEPGNNNLPNHNGVNNRHGILISIKDTGPGIPEKDISRVFDPFFTTKSSGTGLGLAVSHGIIEEHDAMITISPNHPVGTCFDILFPSSLTTEDSA